MAAKSLQEFSEDTVISNLGNLAQNIKSRFSCGGALPVESISLVYKKQSGVWSSKALQLPADTTDGENNLQEFLETCSTASFGVGGETVTDKDYRDALKLEPDCFRADFEIANTTVLSNILTIMSVGRVGSLGSSSIRAELYKLNIYLTGGHFKAHVDTPRSKDMFGSLVVCLPSQFTGEALVTRHQGRQVTFDWSSPPTATH